MDEVSDNDEIQVSNFEDFIWERDCSSNPDIFDESDHDFGSLGPDDIDRGEWYYTIPF